MIPKDINGICELFDCGIRHDISDPPGFKPKDDQHIRPVPVYAIGVPPELSAGLYGYTLTSWFYSMKALERYCRSTKGREAINQKAAKVFPDDWLPDYENWLDAICDGCFDRRGINSSEHKCHTWNGNHKISQFYVHKGEQITGGCQCPSCSPASQENKVRQGSKGRSQSDKGIV